MWKEIHDELRICVYLYLSRSVVDKETSDNWKSTTKSGKEIYLIVRGTQTMLLFHVMRFFNP